MKIEIPEKVHNIISLLEENGYEAYAVGGCIRDALLGRIPEDWDITTSAKPEQIKSVFRRTVDTGIEHGTVTVLIGKESFEVTTYRIDGDYKDHRHPDQVCFTDDLIQDLARRDFTINAMAYSPSAGFIDVFEGIDDLKKKTIRCVGNPLERFDEDALRMLRAVRFSAQLNFEIHKETANAIRSLASTLQFVSAERIQTELVKLITSYHPEHFHQAYELGLTAVFMPEYDQIVGVEQNTPNHVYTVDVHTLKSMAYIENNKVLRLTMLMHDFGKPAVKKTIESGRDIFYKHPEVSTQLAEKILKRLKFDNATIQKTCRLIKWHGLKYAADEINVRRALNRVGRDIFPDFINVQAADILAKSPAVIAGKLELLNKKKYIYEKIIEQDQCFEIKTLAVDGNDLIRAGIPKGPLIGKVLDRLVEHVIDNQELNTKEQLLELALEVKDAADIFEEKTYFF